MVMATNIVRRDRDDPRLALERNWADDARLVQRINAAAAELHGFWSAGWLVDEDQRARRRAGVAALQAEIDGLYEQRRQLVAQRAVLRDTREGRRRNAVWSGVLAA